MVINLKVLWSLVLFTPLCLTAQNLPRVERNLSPTRRIVSVDEKIVLNSDKWFSGHNNSELGIIASSEAGWQNKAHIYGFDCEVVFQIVDGTLLANANKLHGWLKFPKWSRIKTTQKHIGERNAYVLTRKGFPQECSDQIIVIGLDGNKILVMRMIALGSSKEEDRLKIIKDFVAMNTKEIASSKFTELEIGQNIAKFFLDNRDVPDSVSDAAKRLVCDLSAVEQSHLLKNIHNEYELLERWPTVGDEVEKLHWIMIYWGLNDPNSPLRKSIGRLSSSDNGGYILEVLKSTEKLLREKH